MKRLPLILAAIIGLAMAGSTLAGKSGGTRPEQAFQALVAPGHRAHRQRAACPVPETTLTLTAASGRYLVLEHVCHTGRSLPRRSLMTPVPAVSYRMVPGTLVVALRCGAPLVQSTIASGTLGARTMRGSERR